MNTTNVEVSRMLANARMLREVAQCWIDEENRPCRSGNVTRDCLAIGWTSPDAMLRAAESIETDAALVLLCMGGAS